MPQHLRSARRTAAVVLVVLPLAVAAALSAFAWPLARLEPRELPLGIVGPPAARSQIESKLAAAPGSFERLPYADEAAARDAIRDRRIYGAVVATEAGPRLLVASAASATVAQALREAFARSDGGGVDVVPAPTADPRGVALNASILPLTLISLAAGVVLTLLVGSARQRLAALLGAATAAALAAIVVVQGWLGVLDGNWLANAACVALGIAAMAGAAAGALALGGRRAAAAVVLLTMFVGNPWSGVAVAPELLPTPVGAIGQLLPPGALGNLLRSSAFFDGAAAWGHVLVLAVWAACGAAAVALGSRARGARAGSAA